MGGSPYSGDGGGNGDARTCSGGSLSRARRPYRPYKGRVHPKIVQELLGHAQIGLTLDNYSHVLPGMGDAA